MSPSLNGNGTVNGKHKHDDDFGFGTRAIHIGSTPDPHTGAVIPPISLSTTYAQHAVGVTHAGGYEYTRSGNPNRDALETTLAALERGGAYALAFSSGSAATATVLQSLGADAHIVCVNDVYGGTFRYMNRVAAEHQRLETTFVDLENAEDDDIIRAIRPNTKLVWVESPTNPTLRLIDIRRLSSLLQTLPTPPLLLVDNTFLSPFFSSPLLLGADIVLHSLTKYINGHSDVLMGALILPPQHHALHTRLRYLQNAGGAVPSPHDCWLAQRGAKTLHLRMKAHGLNALSIAHFLSSSPHVEQVLYPGLSTHPKHKLAISTLSPHAKEWIASLPPSDTKHGIPYGGMLSFRIRGGAQAAEKFLTSTRLFTLAESLGGVESLAELPARMTHASVPEKEREVLGIDEGLVRLSVGVEDVRDLVGDVKRALDEAARVMV